MNGMRAGCMSMLRSTGVSKLTSNPMVYELNSHAGACWHSPVAGTQLQLIDSHTSLIDSF